MSLILPSRYQSRATGAQLQATLMDGIRNANGLAAHIVDSRRQDATGLPDVVAVCNNIIAFLEIKGRGDALTLKQAEWIAALQDADETLVEVVTWRNLDQVLAALGIEAR